MFKNLLKHVKQPEEDIFAPVSGTIVPINEVDDSVFADKLMGEGIAVLPKEGSIVSPVDGEIVKIFPTKHAIGLKTPMGQEILVHIGLDTVKLKGEGFILRCKENQHVKVGQILVDVDWAYLKKQAKSTVVPIVVTNSQGQPYIFDWMPSRKVIGGKTRLFTTILKKET